MPYSVMRGLRGTCPLGWGQREIRKEGAVLDVHKMGGRGRS